jgi:L-amino acid N-acyltransferase YncA
MQARPSATVADAAQICVIYNQAIEDRVGTFETLLRTEAMVRVWFDDVHPVVVVEQDNEIIAYAATFTYSTGACYAGIADFSVYVRRDWRGKGAVKVAMKLLLERADEAGFWKVSSLVFVDNVPSRKLLGALGFREVGIYEKHGQMDGVWRDVLAVEYLLLSKFA